MKKTPIEEHKSDDVILMRKILLSMIEDEDITKKDRIEAAKLLSRLHHSLQVDRTTVKAVATSGPNIEKEKQEAISQRIDDILARDMSDEKETVN